MKHTNYIFYIAAIVAGIGLGTVFSQNVTQKRRAHHQKIETEKTEIENLSSQEVDKMIAERANLIEKTNQENAIKFNPHARKPLNPIEIEKLNRKVRQFDPSVKMGERNADQRIKVTWQMLKDVKFEERYYEKVKAHLLYPVFGKSVRKLDGQRIYIRGFVIPADEVNNIYVLSANSYASCFFCGNAGPESVMDLKMKITPALKKKLQLDAVFTFKGTLKLNSTDIDQLNYILENATLYDIK